jgi:hypothetical protein
MASRRHFIFSNGKSVTLKRIAGQQVNAYDEILHDRTQFTESTIKALMNPNENIKADQRTEGIGHDSEELWATVEGSVTLAEGDFIVDGAITYQIIEFHTMNLKGTKVQRVKLRWERRA